MSDAPVTAETSTAETDAPDWRDAIEEPGLRRVAEKFTSPIEVVKSYAALQSRLGRSVVKPGSDAGAEEIAAYHRQLGVPETPEGYEVALSESLPEALRDDPATAALQAEFLKVMHGAGAPPAVVQQALDWYYGQVGESLKQQTRAAEERRAEAEAGLRREWGGDHERNVALAQRAVRSFGDDGFVDFLESHEAAGVKLGDHPAFLRAFAAIGKGLGEDPPLAGAGESRSGSVQARIDALHALQQSDPQKYASRAVQGELQGLYAKLYGGQPVVGSEGRRL